MSADTITITDAVRLLQAGKDHPAKALLERIVLAEADNRDAWYLLAAASHRLGEREEAARAYGKVIALDPRHADAHYFLGNVHGERGEHDAAARCYARACELNPRSAQAARNLGATLQALQRTQEAIDCYRAFLRRAAPTLDIVQNLGNALSDAGAHEEALAAYRQALQLDPSRAHLHVQIGNLLEEFGQREQAVHEYERALALDPNCVPAWRCLGAALADAGRPEDAVACYSRGRATGDQGLALREATVLPAVPRSLADLREWRERYAAGIARLRGSGLRLEQPPAQAGCASFFLAYHGECNRELNTSLAALHQEACPSLLWTAPHCGRPRRGGRIKVGFISRFMYDHSIGRTTRGLIERLSRDEFEVVALAVPPVRNDETAGRIRAAADRALIVPPSLDAAREAIAALELDVLFYQDIGMEPFTYFLAFSRLAPVQCTSFGHPDTTGIRNLDYFVSSDLFERAGADGDYSERLALLHGLGTLAYYHRPQVRPARREDFGLPPDANLYLCPQTLFKLHPDFDALLGAILRSDPRGVLVLIEGQARAMRERLEARLRAAYPDVMPRILFLPRQSGERFRSLLGACDVILDTLYFNGMNTSLEAFAAGAPVVTLPSRLQRGRHTTGMYRRMQLDDGIALNDADYVRIAVALGQDRDRRATLQGEIRERCPVLFEDMRVVQEFERFFREAVQ